MSRQIKKHANRTTEDESENIIRKVISTGSTLLDLAISGTAIKGGGIPIGIIVEIFGPPSCGKTVIMCEIAGNIQKDEGEIKFFDPEDRLDRQYASLFGVDITDDCIATPDTVTELFKEARSLEWENEDSTHGVIVDSLSALTTQLEIAEGDPYGGRRAKEFSQELRLTCRILKKQNILLVCSNQIRENIGGGPYAPKTKSTGGKALPHYASVRLQCSSPKMITQKKKIGKINVSRTIGGTTNIKVYKNSVDKPLRVAPVSIIYDYGIDDIRQNLQFIKHYMGERVYRIGEHKLGNGLEKAIRTVEDHNMVKALRKQTINLWTKIEAKFSQSQDRRPKHDG